MAHDPVAAPRQAIYACKFNQGEEQHRFEMLLDRTDFTEKMIIRCLEAGSFYEREVSCLMLEALRLGDVVIDVGAHCGYFTLLASTLVGAQGHVLSFEPAPNCVARLSANVARNRLSNVTVIERVASNRSGETTFHINSDNSGGNALWDPGEWPGNKLSRQTPHSIPVQMTTLDAEWKARGLGVPKLIKIDAEGAEQFVLEGARELLQDCRVPLVFAEFNKFALSKLGCSQASLRGVMEGLGYSAFLVYYSGALPRLVPPGTMIRSRLVFNILFATPSTIAKYWPVTAFDPRTPG